MIYVSQEVMQLENWKELIADFLDEKKMDPRLVFELSGDNVAVSLEYGELSNLLPQYYYITHIVT